MRVPAMTLKPLIRVLAVAACVAMAAVAPNVGAAQTPGAVQVAPAAPAAFAVDQDGLSKIPRCRSCWCTATWIQSCP